MIIKMFKMIKIIIKMIKMIIKMIKMIIQMINMIIQMIKIIINMIRVGSSPSLYISLPLSPSSLFCWRLSISVLSLSRLSPEFFPSLPLCYLPVSLLFLLPLSSLLLLPSPMFTPKHISMCSLSFSLGMSLLFLYIDLALSIALSLPFYCAFSLSMFLPLARFIHIS